MRKVCSYCKIEKDVQEFHRCKTRSDGRHPYCKQCRSNKSKNDSHLVDYRKKWYESNKETVLSRQEKRYQDHKEDVKEYKKQHYLTHHIAIKEKSSLYYQEHKKDPAFLEKKRIGLQRWRMENKHVVAWRSLLSTVLKKLKQNKNDTTQNTLGYTADEFRIHIEQQWLPEMTWENHGQWHVDHIKPVHEFPTTTDVKVVNALSNLRPLWATNRTINGEFHEGNLNRKRR